MGEHATATERHVLSLARTLINRAEDLIRPHGAWAQGAYARDTHGRAIVPTARQAVCWDVVGAVVRATDVVTECCHEPELRHAWRQAARLALRALARAAEPQAADGSLALVATALARYNDAHDQSDVHTLFAHARQDIELMLYT
jgi:hypothetical protein